MAKPAELEGYWDRYAEEVRDFWARARARHDIPDGVEPHVFPWGDVPVFADLMLFLLLQGGKRSTAHLELEHEVSGKPPRKVGKYSLVLDGFGRPGAVIRTTSVEIKPFKAVDKAFHQRTFGADDHKINRFRAAVGNDAVEIIDRDIDAFGQLGNAAVAGRATQPGRLRRPRHPPAKRVLTPTRADNQNMHGKEPL